MTFWDFASKNWGLCILFCVVGIPMLLHGIVVFAEAIMTHRERIEKIRYGQPLEFPKDEKEETR